MGYPTRTPPAISRCSLVVSPACVSHSTSQWFTWTLAIRLDPSLACFARNAVCSPLGETIFGRVSLGWTTGRFILGRDALHTSSMRTVVQFLEPSACLTRINCLPVRCLFRCRHRHPTTTCYGGTKIYFLGSSCMQWVSPAPSGIITCLAHHRNIRVLL